MGRNILKLETKGIEELAEKLKELNGDVNEAVTATLEKAGKKIGEDTERAMSRTNLPAGGKYSRGETAQSIIHEPKAEWKGNVATIGVGFDFGMPGAGGYLITGTPKMQPNNELHRIYKEKRYMSEIQKEMQNTMRDYIDKAMR